MFSVPRPGAGAPAPDQPRQQIGVLGHAPGGAVVVLSRNVGALQIELPRLAQHEAIGLRRVEPLDDSLESVFGYLVEQ